MTTVVQATCPGCQQTLRIPSDWLQQTIRCKMCGMVLQAKQPAAKASGRTPVPAPRKVKKATPPPPTKAVPPSLPAAVTNKPPVAAPVAAFAPPVAVPVAAVHIPAAAPFGNSLFDDLEHGEQAHAAPGVAAPRRLRRRNTGWWKGAAIAAAVLALTGAGLFFGWKYINPALFPQTPSVAQSNPPGHDLPDPTPTDKPADKDKAGKPVDKPADKDKAGKPVDKPTDKDKAAKPVDKDKDKAAKPVDKPADKDKDPGKPPPVDPPKGAQVFPRRALVISVHNYLYANPVHAGIPTPQARNIPNFLDALSRGLHIPLNQIAHLSDGAKNQPRPPLRDVIKDSLTSFLQTSRPQDRVLVFFIGHAVEIGDEPYLVPLEGELDNAATLIPLKWVYGELAKSPARQKVLVLDVNRLSPGLGLERPNGGPMGPKMDALLKTPPDGVQVLTACVEGQQSYELEDSPMGLFLDELNSELTPDANHKGLKGRIQKPEDPLPLDVLVEQVNADMKNDLETFKLTQTARLTGQEPKDGAPYDRSESMPPAPTLAEAPKAANIKEVQGVLDEVGLPSVKASREDSGIRFEVLPPFPAEKMAPYMADSKPDSPVRLAVVRAREVLWAVSASHEPPNLAENVKKLRQEYKVNLSVMKDGYRAPAMEAPFKKQVFDDERQVADMLGNLMEALDALKEAGKDRDAETKRWQVNYDYTLARLEMQIAYLFEYESLLGSMRKELPPKPPGTSGWRLASQTTLRGDSQGKKLAAAAKKTLDKLAADNPGTPWEVLAKREKLTALGLEWQAVK